jgi:D-xylose 1-dehydrogenase (NADP+, D-xylono-1,5-lactone-forming)
MTERLRVGILSTAKINDAILEGARASAGAEVVAVASRDRGRAEAYAAEKGIPRAHGSYEDLLADEAVEAVYVPLPNSMHLPWSERALTAGKHVLCEKPLSPRVADVEAAFDAAERAGRILMEAFMWRYHPSTEAIVRLVEEGAIGRLRVVRAAFGFTLDPGADNVRWAGELEGGALMDVGCYCLSALRLLAGEPERVSGELVEGGVDVDARFAGLLRFGDDVLGTFDCGFDVPKRAGLEIVGEAGTIASLDPWHGRAPVVQLARPDADEPEVVAVEAANPYGLELDDLARAVREGGEPRLGRADAVGQARAIEALYRAARDGGAVTV